MRRKRAIHTAIFGTILVTCLLAAVHVLAYGEYQYCGPRYLGVACPAWEICQLPTTCNVGLWWRSSTTTLQPQCMAGGEDSCWGGSGNGCWIFTWTTAGCTGEWSTQKSIWSCYGICD